MTGGGAYIPLADPLSLALPSTEQTLILRACLLEGEPGRLGWARWIEKVPDPISYLRQEEEGLKGMLPLLLAALRKNEVDVESSLLTVLKTALVKEEARAGSFHRICREILLALEESGTQPTVIRGADLAYTVYENLVLRHCDGVDLLVEEMAWEAALQAVASLGCSPATTRAEHRPGFASLSHTSGLGVDLRASLSSHPQIGLPHGIRARRRIENIAEVPTRILSPADNLLYTCALVYDAETHPSIRWVSDCWHLVRRYPDLNWPSMLATAKLLEVTLPLWLTLSYLKKNLDVPIPEDVLSGLAADARDASGAARRFALAGARRSRRGGLRRMISAARGWRDRLIILSNTQYARA